MRPLTDDVPKPLLTVRGKALMDWHVQALVRSGVDQLVINTAWLGEKIERHCQAYDLEHQNHGRPTPKLVYSHEGRDFGGALETAGGIARALPWLGDVFWVVAGDVFVPDFLFLQASVQRFTASDKLAHLWLVPNPPQHPRGDFCLREDGLVMNLPTAPSTGTAQGCPSLTYSTIGLYRAGFFHELPSGNPQGLKRPLAPLLRVAIAQQRVSGELYTQAWADVGTPERLKALNDSD